MNRLKPCYLSFKDVCGCSLEASWQQVSRLAAGPAAAAGAAAAAGLPAGLDVQSESQAMQLLFCVTVLFLHAVHSYTLAIDPLAFGQIKFAT